MIIEERTLPLDIIGLKHKYTKRTGSAGNYQYYYGDDKKKESNKKKKETATDRNFKKVKEIIDKKIPKKEQNIRAGTIRKDGKYNTYVMQQMPYDKNSPSTVGRRTILEMQFNNEHSAKKLAERINKEYKK